MGTVLHIPMTLQRRGGRKLIIAAEGTEPAPRRRRPDPVIVRALSQAFRWLRLIETGEMKSITSIARSEGVSDTYVQRRLNLTCLSPRIVEASLDGALPLGTKLADLLTVLDHSWSQQEARLEIDHA